ncbi:MarR family transcriptional regulator [Saxibacter everestensis]|uniref:MarR family transcriptional regulator n=1 Tax=Saxibacter everestensis TaxID=2909229 RepID=A0ABY8QQD0_9MICO|nr:MarR family transcriptional regulator [Brevibacteriaceae bacterium ZFBP1038]
MSLTENSPPRRSDTDQLAIDLVVMSSRLTRAAARLAETTVPSAVWRALAVLEEHGPMRVGDFAVMDRCSQPTATAMFQRLEKAGSVERVSDPEDGRAVLISLSDSGRRTLAELRTGIAHAIGPRLETLSVEERAILAETVAIQHRLLTEKGRTPPADEETG